MSRNRIIAFAVPFFIVALTVLGSAAPSSADRGGREAVRSSVRGGSQPVARQGGRDFVTRSPGRGGGIGRGGSSTRYLGPRYGHSHFSGSVWIGPGWGWDPFFYPYYPYYPYPSYPYYTPPTVVVPQEPQEYIVPEADEQQETGYWYYCRKPQGYYPYVERCPGGWMKVLPDTTPPEGVLDDKENEDE